jgi:hypothetical protein
MVTAALLEGGVVDITTTGRKSGRTSRIEIVFHNLDGDLYITGRPGTRDWYANVLADPRFTLHLKRGLEADLEATAEPIREESDREPLLLRILTEGFGVDLDKARSQLPVWVEQAPLIRFAVTG